jgi:hypothetical protein
MIGICNTGAVFFYHVCSGVLNISLLNAEGWLPVLPH